MTDDIGVQLSSAAMSSAERQLDHTGCGGQCAQLIQRGQRLNQRNDRQARRRMGARQILDTFGLGQHDRLDACVTRGP